MATRLAFVGAVLALLLQSVSVMGVTKCGDSLCFNCVRNSKDCAECRLGYGFQAGTCRPCAQKECVRCRPPGKCYFCSNPSSYEGALYPVYTDESFVCRNCTRHPFSSGCEECNSKGVCIRCTVPNFRLVGGKCVRCQGGDTCARCNAKGACLECIPSYRLDGRRCVKCPGGIDCVACNAQRCTRCANGYGLNRQGVCVRCSDRNCLNCQANFRVCKECFPYDDAGEVRIGPFFIRNGSCVDVKLEGCKVANNDGTCKACVEAYKLVRGRCQPCTVGFSCRRCDSDVNRCDLCFFDQFYDSAKNACVRCMEKFPNCSKCTKDRCTACAYRSWPGFGLVGGKCQNCKDVNCVNCDGDVSRCKQCNDNFPYQLKDGKCRLPA